MRGLERRRKEGVGGENKLVSCPARTCLPARNSLVNEVEFLGLIPKKW